MVIYPDSQVDKNLLLSNISSSERILTQEYRNQSLGMTLNMVHTESPIYIQKSGGYNIVTESYL